MSAQVTAEVRGDVIVLAAVWKCHGPSVPFLLFIPPFAASFSSYQHFGSLITEQLPYFTQQAFDHHLNWGLSLKWAGYPVKKRQTDMFFIYL
jgi:hypothetical protein